MDKFFKASLGIGALMVGVAFLYYFVVFLPDKEAARQKHLDDQQLTKTLESAEKDHKRNACFEWASKNKRTNWASSCESLNLSEDCLLPPAKFNRIDKIYSEQKADCFKLFPSD